MNAKDSGLGSCVGYGLLSSIPGFNYLANKGINSALDPKEKGLLGLAFRGKKDAQHHLEGAAVVNGVNVLNIAFLITDIVLSAIYPDPTQTKLNYIVQGIAEINATTYQTLD